MKKLLSIAAVLIMTSAMFAVDTYALTLDGKIGNREWENSESTALDYPEGTANGVEFAYVNYIVEDETNSIYLGFNIEHESLDAPENTGISVSFADGTAVSCLTGGEPVFDKNLYDAEAAGVYDTRTNSVLIEMRITVKRGLKNVSGLNLTLFDSEKIPSNMYYLEFPGVLQTAVSESDTTKISAKKTSKATKKKTSDKKSSSGGRKANTFNGAEYIYEENEEASEITQQTEETQQSFSYIQASSQTAQDKSGNNFYILTFAGLLCAAAAAFCAVYSARKKKQNIKDADNGKKP